MNQVLLQRFCKFQSIQIFNKSLSVVSNFNSVSRPYLFKKISPISCQVRTFWESFPNLRPLLHEKDGVDRNNHEIVYRSSMFNYVFYGQVVSQFVTIIQIIGSTWYAYKSYVAQEVVTTITHVGPFVVKYDMITLMIISIFTIQNVLIYIAARACLLRVYYNENEDKYVFVSLSINPFRSKLFYCKPGELVNLNSGPLGFVFGNHNVLGKQYFLRFDCFKSMYHYNHLVGDDNYK